MRLPFPGRFGYSYAQKLGSTPRQGDQPKRFVDFFFRNVIQIVINPPSLLLQVIYCQMGSFRFTALACYAILVSISVPFHQQLEDPAGWHVPFQAYGDIRHASDKVLPFFASVVLHVL